METEKHRISFCTTCMNRAFHLEQTLPVNISDNADYDNAEFVVLNYNSRDHLHEYILDTFPYEMKKGVLKYFRTDKPTYFNNSHAKNCVSRLSSGDIICNLDADNFTGPGFANYINSRFVESKGVYLVSIDKLPSTSVIGRVCLKKEDFYKVEGYDENMFGYGWEDIDFYNRLNLIGLNREYISGEKFLNSIDHDSDSRYLNYQFYSSLTDIYISFLDPRRSKLLLLNNDNTYKVITIYTDDVLYIDLSPGIDFTSIIEGNFRLDQMRIYLDGKGFRLVDNKLFFGKDVFRKVVDQDFFLKLKKRYSVIFNFNLLNRNLFLKNIKPNFGVYGKVDLLKN